VGPGEQVGLPVWGTTLWERVDAAIRPGVQGCIDASSVTVYHILELDRPASIDKPMMTLVRIHH